MDYVSPYDQGKHEAIARSIRYERKVIAQHYRVIGKLQDRLLQIGTPDEQLQKRLKLREIFQLTKPANE